MYDVCICAFVCVGRFGQSTPPLVEFLKDILRRYPEGGQILKVRNLPWACITKYTAQDPLESIQLTMMGTVAITHDYVWNWGKALRWGC